MGYIALAAVFGIVFLQGSGAIPMSSVGGPMTIAMVGFTAMLAVAIYEAWTMKRGSWLDREYPRHFPRRFSGRPVWGHDCRIDPQPVHERVEFAGGRRRRRDVDRTRRNDGRDRFVRVGINMGREPVAGQADAIRGGCAWRGQLIL